jgi:hypothetical protein
MLTQMALLARQLFSRLWQYKSQAFYVREALCSYWCVEVPANVT